MVVPSGSTERNDRIEKRSTSLGEMTIYLQGPLWMA